MKKLIQRCSILFLFFVSGVSSAVLFAQDQVTTTTTKTKTDFTMQPWMWVLGGAVFILILVAILKGGNKNRDQS